MTEKEFVTQYVLNRANAHVGGLGSECVYEAIKCYEKIKQLKDYEQTNHGVWLS